jgi:hypothetical protein
MNALEEKTVQCPYCGESIDVLMDCSISHQNYIEDCQVCCRPVIFDVTVGNEGELRIVLTHENE